MFLFEPFHHASKKKWRDPTTLPDLSSWPAEWKTTHIKRYDRFPTTILPHVQPIDLPISEVIQKRSSHREYARQMTEAQLSALLFFSCGDKNSSYNNDVGSRVYASAGSRYPTEVYVCIIHAIGQILAGVYHYDVERHGLTRLLDTCSVEVMNKAFIFPHIGSAQCAIVCTSVFERSTSKYGELAYRQALIEVGAITGQMHLVATALSVGSVSVSGFVDTELEALLDIDGVSESVMHTVVFG